MKKSIAILFLVFTTLSCSLNNDEPNYHLQTLPVVSVDIPTEFVLGETYPITVYYYRPSNCHTFAGFYYDKYLNERTVAVQNYVEDCTNYIALNDYLVENTFNFYVTNNGSYIFKFWQGEDANGDDIFLEIEVPVL